MSNDLISRKAVIELIESKCTDGCLGTEDTTLIDAYGLIDDVSDIPTAYNPDKVMEQINGMGKSYCNSVKCDKNCRDCDHGSIMRAIQERMKEGGVE